MGLLVGLAVILFILWLAGLALHILGGFIHVLLIIAIIALIAGFFGGRSSTTGA